LQKILGVHYDKTPLTILKPSRELRDFCGFSKLPDASKISQTAITCFRQDFVGYIEKMFENLVEITEPVCREIDAKKADYLIYDPTGILPYVLYSHHTPFINNFNIII
jgi:hypothetical protein